ncbi:hypothetical protein AK812_SmicGene13326 [Symbiodinium microadriaticum]|uniref:RNase H type-1 domain-containing protein n=1 Tax=Symbiodinium microadriaticum TaxID=2951 RepID=A0A1Q9E8G2_SYMMI|nr:hypothetical protein AK812_SmicGene13326 [Symbiodinium microadriaticum]
MVQLKDGDVITVLLRPADPPRKYRARDLFQPEAVWATPRDWFNLHPCESVCILFRDKRYTVPNHHYYGRNLVSYVSEMLHVSPHGALMCSYPIRNLDVQGELSTFLVAVAEVPSPEQTGVTRARARDIFVLLDPRPFGQKPYFLLLHHPVIHLPTIEAMLGLSTGRGRRLGASGGSRQGDEVTVQGNATLVLYPEEISDASSESENSDSSSPQVLPPWAEDSPSAAADVQLADADTVEAALPGDLARDPDQAFYNESHSPTVADGPDDHPHVDDVGDNSGLPLMVLLVAALPEAGRMRGLSTLPVVLADSGADRSRLPWRLFGKWCPWDFQAPSHIGVMWRPDSVQAVFVEGAQVLTTVTICGFKDFTKLACSSRHTEHPSIKADSLPLEFQRGDSLLPDPASDAEAVPCLGYQTSSICTCKLLQEPDANGSTDGITAARTATRLLGGHWPFPPYAWPLEAENDADTQSSVTDLGEGVTVDIVVYLLTPDYTPEQLDLTAVLPQSLHEILDLVRTCRAEDRRALFPELVELTPQPDLLLALPAWPYEYACVGLDLSLFDGRIFAAVALPVMDTYALCEVAGLAPHAEVDIYLPGATFPVPRGEQFELRTGHCIIFRRPGARCPVAFHLHAMLQSHLTWEHSPVFPRDRSDNGYCVVGPEGCILFRLHTERAMYYRADIALLTHLHPTRAVLTPVNPQPTDGCLRGWECRAVIVATDRETRTVWDGDIVVPTIGVLDARPLLRGWLPLRSHEGWLNLAPIRDALNRTAPTGWAVVFPSLPDHWTWICFYSGCILVAALAPVAQATCVTPNLAQGCSLTASIGAATRPGTLDNGPHGASVSCLQPYLDGAWLGTWLGGLFGPHGLGLSLFGAMRDFSDIAPWASGPLIALAHCDISLACCLCLLAIVSRRRLLGVLFLGLFLAGAICPVAAVQLPPVHQPEHGLHAHVGLRIPPFAVAACSSAVLPVPGGARPLPTPCRSDVVPRYGLCKEDDVLQHCVQNLTTLLEESAQASDHWAFMAATLVETLWEHFAEATLQPPCHRVPLALADHLPAAQVHDLTAASFAPKLSMEDLAALLSPGTWPLRESLPPGIGGPFTHMPASAISPTVPVNVSIYTDGSYLAPHSAWAFAVFVSQPDAVALVGWMAGAVVTTPEHPLWVGANRHHALVGEQCALLWALVWALQAPIGCDIRLFVDCEVALRQTTGQYGSSNQSSLACTCRSLFQALVASRPGIASAITHVRSHTGVPENELVDLIAKWAATSDGDSSHFSAHMHLAASVCRSPHLAWLWLIPEAIRHPGLWPRYDGHGFTDLDRAAPRAELSPGECRGFFGLDTNTVETNDAVAFVATFCLFTLNTQTLAESAPSADTVQNSTDTHFVGRAAFLREQFDWYGAHVVAVQEARGPSDAMYNSDTHVRICTGRDKQGNYGVELWFSRRHPFSHIGSTPICFEPSHLLVMYSSPRELFVRYCRGDLRILFVSVHGPVATCPQREAWWREFAAKVARLCHGSQLVILGDLNAHFDQSIQGHVGDLVFPTKHPLPTALTELLHKHGGWIPSTFSDCHPGPTETWWPPSGGPGKRLDYAILPLSWCVGPGESAVFKALDWGQSRVDHYALRTWATLCSSSRPSQKRSRITYDRDAMLTDKGRETLSAIFASVPQPSWRVDVHRHYAQIQSHLTQALSTAFPPAKGRCRSSHFSPFTWQLRQRRIWLRKRVTHLQSSLRHFCLRSGWVAWKTKVRHSAGVVVTLLRQGRDLLGLAAYVADLRATRVSLRKAIRADVSSRIHDTASEAHYVGTGTVVSRLHCLLGPSKRRTRQQQGLPGLELADGNRANTPQEVEQAWVDHFSSIEAGEQRHPCVITQACIQDQAARDLEHISFNPGELPTRLELEHAFRNTMLHRAFGVDGVPAEALHAAPGPASQALFSLILKCALRVEEPLHFKGGSLFAIWKGKSSPSRCDAYRGILVSSTVGKAYHSVLRSKNVPTLTTAMSPLQIGGLPRRPVTLAAHVVRMHQSWSISSHLSQAVLFLDLREAFYRIIRPMVLGFTGSETDVQRILQAVQLPPGVAHDLRAHLQEVSLFQKEGASPWLAAVTSEALCHTWFRFEHGSLLTETGIGTRPGDNLADLIFSYVFAQVLRQVRQTIQDTAGVTLLPWHPDMLNELWPVSACTTEEIPLLDCTWMDDAALVLQAHTAPALVDKLRQTAGVLLDGCLGRALLPNLDRGKTEAVVSLRGPGSRQTRAQMFRDDPATLDVNSDLWPGARIQLVPLYRHLGGHIHQSGALIREVRHRVALAWATYTKRRKTIFASSFVTWQDKVTIFESLVLSVLLYGAGTWNDLSVAERKCLESAYHRMAFGMMKPRYSADEARHLGASRALSLLGLPSMCTLLHLARLRHLQSCVTVSSREFWALAHVEGSWLSTARAAVTWLREHLPREDALSDARTFWAHWAGIMCDQPGRWKRLLSNAQARAIRRETWQAAGQYHRGLLAKQLRFAGGILITPPPAEWDQRYCCGPCQRTFSSRQQWSVHAFKTHGRCTLGRGILEGRQCQACLHQFATNLKLCKHLAYSTSCRHRLQVAGFHCEVGPGQGSARAEDPGAVQAPVLQAEGPVLPLAADDWLDESDRPIAEIVDCFSLLDFDSPDPTDEELWRRARLAFASVCAPTPRLRLTAETLLSQIRVETPLGSRLQARLEHVLEWICQADIVDWLVPTPAHIDDEPCTFRDGALVLQALEVADLQFAPVPSALVAPVFIFVGPDEWCHRAESSTPNSIAFPATECLASLARHENPTFFEGPYDGVAFVLKLVAWSGFACAPDVISSAPAFWRQLSQETFEGDLVRLTLRLWSQGVPAMLQFPESSASAIAPLLEVRRLLQGRLSDGMFLRNDWDSW